MSTWTDIVIPLAAGLGAGTLASLVAPWAQWGVDKRRDRRAARAAVIAKARDLVAYRQDAERSEILAHPGYLAIRPHLRGEVEAELRAQTVHVVRDPHGTAGNFYLGRIRDEADRLERKWRLS